MTIIPAWARFASQRSVAFLLALALLGGSFAWPQTTQATTSSILHTVSQGFYNQWDGDESDIDETSGFSCSGGNYIRDDGGAGSNNDRETFNLNISSIPNGSVITDVEIISYSRDDDDEHSGQNGQFRHLVRLNGTNFLSTGSPISPGDDCDDETRTVDVTDTVKSGATDLEIGVEKSNSSTKVRVGALHARVTYTIPDTEDPTVTINQAVSQVDPTGDTPISFTAVFSEPVTGFEDSDVLVSGTAGPTDADVTGGPTTYTVKLSGMTSDGTVVASIPAYAAEDGAGNGNEASESTDNIVTYNLPNRAPVANADSVTTDEDTPVGITLTGSDPDSDPVTYEVVADPNHGDLTGTPPNLTYTPDDDYNGTDAFQFRTYDGSEYSDNAEVDITINPVEDGCPDGYHFNESEQCVPNEPDPQPEQCIIVSDTTDFYVEGESNAVLTFVHAAWADAVSGASWIWGDAEVANPGSDETQTFAKTFYLEDVPTNADIEVGADNGATVVVNGTTVLTQNLADQNYNDPVDSVDVTAYLVAGANTLEITVTNLAYETTDPHVNPAGLIYKLTVDGTDCGEPQDDPVNSCIVPEGEEESSVTLGETPGAEDTLQVILDDAYGAFAPDAALDQDNFSEWTGTGNTVNFTVENISEDSNSGHTHVFGYYLNGGAFTPVFREGLVGAPYDTAANLNFAETLAFSVANVNDIVFAIADWDGIEYTYFATDASLNALGEVHGLSYNVDDNQYAIAFEDLPFSEGDEDYNDVVVALEVVSCEAGAVCEPGVELLANGTFEVPEVGGSLWDIFNIDEDPNLAWAAEWLNPTDAPEIANLELQEAGLNGWSATGDGDQWTELDSDWGGPASGQSGEAGQVAITQTIDTVPGETYTLSFDFSPRPGTAAAQNAVEVFANETSLGTVGGTVDATAFTDTSWTSHTFSFEATENETTVTFRDAGTPNDSLGTFVDNASLMCEEPEPTATLSATKIICNDESDLPNWGAGGADITATTAADFLETHPGCRLETDWQFQWVTDADSNVNPGDNIVSPAPSPWYLFGQGVGDGSLTTEIPAGGMVWVREVLKDGFIPFTGANTDQDVSAEIYCSTDVLNYDNWDWINPVEEGETYYCVAFNAPTNPDDQCDPDASTVLLSSDGDGEGSLLTLDESGPASLVGEFIHEAWADTVDALWIWKDSGTSAEDALNGTTETFTRTFDIVGTPLDSTLEIAADNGYEVKVNGTQICANAGELNYGATVTCAVPASTMVNGENTITFEIVNIDHETANDPENNPAGLVYKLTVNENECELPPAPFSTVTMCKTDAEGYGLPGWTLMLQGDSVETVNVAVNNANGTDTITSLEDGLSYIAVASGLWLNSGQTGNWVDAEYSTTDGWTTPFDGFLGYSTDILELQINESFDPGSDWGPYSASHIYAQSFIQPSDGSANFRIYDGHPVPTVQAGWYSDNTESSLAVDLYEGYAGVTGEDGCVTFEDVPYGAYTATELLQSGWQHYATWDGETVVDGGAVSVNGETEYFTIQNRLIDDGGEGEGSDTGTLTIVKETNGVEGLFTFQVGGNESFSNVEIATEGGTGSEEIELEPGTYSVTENVPEGWTLESVTCEYEGESEGSEIANGHQIQIYEDEDVTCTFVNEGTSSSDGNTSRTSNNDGGGDGDGEVLGATDEASCGPLLSTFLRMGINNDSTEVGELQNFLNGEMGSGLPVTGVFGPMTDAAVHAFQIKYWEEVLQPWFNVPGSSILDQDDSTGYVYKTTQRMVNNIFCPALNLPMPELP